MGWKITGADQSVIASRYRRFAFDKEESGAISVAARQQLLRAMWLEKWKRGTYGAIIERRTSVKTVSLGSLAFDRAAKDGLRGGCMPVHILSFIRILSCIKDPGPRRETVTKTRPRGPVSPSNRRSMHAFCTLSSVLRETFHLHGGVPRLFARRFLRGSSDDLTAKEQAWQALMKARAG